VDGSSCRDRGGLHFLISSLSIRQLTRFLFAVAGSRALVPAGQRGFPAGRSAIFEQALIEFRG